MIKLIFMIGSILITCMTYLAASDVQNQVNNPRIRDPYIYPDRENNTYLMYAQTGNRDDSDFTGVEVYTSKDLINWEQPIPVLILSEDAGIYAVWAGSY